MYQENTSIQLEMEQDGKVRTNTLETSKSTQITSEQKEFTFTEKEPCSSCKEKEMNLEMPLYTQEEYDNVLTLCDKYSLPRKELEYVYNFYNRVFKEKKYPGCGKCFAIVVRNLKNKYKQLYE